MAQARLRRTWRIDWPIICIVVTLLVGGLIMVYGASYGYGFMEDGAFAGAQDYFVKRQALFALAGLVIMVIASRFDYHLYRKLAVPIAGLAVVALAVMVGYFALQSLSGDSETAKRWLINREGGLGSSIQPVELMRVGLLIYIATWLSAKGKNVGSWGLGLVPFAMLLGLMAGLVLLQGDMSTAVLMVFTALAMFLVAGADFKQFLVLALFGALAGFLVVFVFGYNIERIESWRGSLFDDLTGGNEHIAHGLVALYRGKLTGVGLGHSELKYRLYAAHTDSIICIIGEELGLLGTSLIVLIYGLWTWRGLRVAIAAPDAFGSLLALGLVLWVTFQATLHIGVATRSIPATGTVLPMVSYGGSSLISNLAAVGILLNISAAGGQAMDGGGATDDG